MWLDEVLDKNGIEIGVDINFAFIEQYVNLPTLGKIGLIYIIKDTDKKYIWNNKTEEYNLIVI